MDISQHGRQNERLLCQLQTKAEGEKIDLMSLPTAEQLKLVQEYLIYKTITGSHSYGTNLPGAESDLDIQGVFIAPPKFTLGCLFSIEQVQIPGEDTEIYELAKIVKLAANCNPNIIELLYTDDDILFIDPAWERIRAARHLFLSKVAKFRFSGYAFAQMKRIKGHHRWINHPQPEQEPQLLDFAKIVNTDAATIFLPGEVTPVRDLDDRFRRRCLEDGFLIKINNGTYRIYQSSNFHKKAVSDDGYNIQYVDITENELLRRGKDLRFLGILVVQQEEYQKAHKDWKDYWFWKHHRNPLRSALEEKHGYDCYSSDTQFLTEQGWKYFDDISDEKLATYNQTTGQIEYQNATERHDALYTGNMYRINGTHTDIRVSGNHRMYISPYSRNAKFSFPWEFSQVCRLPDCFDVKRSVNPRVRQFKNDDPCGIDLRFYLKIMGWYISDGSVARRLSNGTPSVLSISQMQGGRLHWRISRARADYMKCGVQINEYSHKRPHKDKKEMTWTIPHREISARITKECGIGSRNKKLPRWVFHLSERMGEILLDAMHAGDGTDSRPGDARIYYTSSPQLADDVHELAFLCGYETSLWGPYDGMYHVHINKEQDENKRLVRSANVSVEKVSGQRIVCFTVPNEILITRRNGKIGIQGNTKHAMHLIRLLRMAKEILTEGKVIVRRPDAEELIAIRNGKFDYATMLAQAEEMEQELDALYDSSSLQHSADIEAINELYIEVVNEFWHRKGITN